jgi:hypothetical protein
MVIRQAFHTLCMFWTSCAAAIACFIALKFCRKDTGYAAVLAGSVPVSVPRHSPLVTQFEVPHLDSVAVRIQHSFSVSPCAYQFLRQSKLIELLILDWVLGCINQVPIKHKQFLSHLQC